MRWKFNRVLCVEKTNQGTNPCGTAFMVVRLQPWPPSRDAVMATNVVDSTVVHLIGRADGSLAVALGPTGSVGHVHTFQRLGVLGSGKAIISFQLNDGSVSMWINGRHLLSGDSAALPLVTIETKDDGPVVPSRVFPTLSANAARGKAEVLFLATVADLDDKIMQGNWYDALRASASLRQLLLDGLLHSANQRHRVSFIFRTNTVMEDFPVAGIAYRWINLDPSTLSTAKTNCLTLNQFLSTRCLFYKGGVATVKDIIKACANAKGGVHFGPPKPGAESHVLSLDEVCTVCGLPASLVALVGLCRITLNGVAPLVARINAQKGIRDD